jgi:hypothetical protein
LPADAIIEEIFFRALARPPQEKEWNVFHEMLSNGKPLRQTLEDILWAVINSKEFIMIR